ncbi:hypothetical protein [Candidatus Lariskella endosymbiont of Hedychridium roseum]|uniref:hypothetical protein n=1 Tax=Candidatus Lariskella endosymbiont of Hedychridium roseum TaxID=3077949 RepID=UPI0030CC0769
MIVDTTHIIGEVDEAAGEIVVDVAALPLKILGDIFGSELIQPVGIKSLSSVSQEKEKH